jgi:hypothetical protein
LETYLIEDALQRVLRPWSAPVKAAYFVSLPRGEPDSGAARIGKQILRTRIQFY